MSRVLHISHLYPRYYDNMYGVAIHKQICALSQFGWMSQVVSPVPLVPVWMAWVNSKWKLYQKIPKQANFDDVLVYYIRYVAFPKAFLYSLSGWLMGGSIIRATLFLQKRFRFNLIHAHMAMPDGYAAMLLSRVLEKPFIVTLQATDLDVTLHRSKQTAQALRKVFLSAQAVIAPTPRLARQFASFFGFSPKIVPYGVSKDEICNQPPLELVNKYQDVRVILSVSRLIPTKGIDLAIYAVYRLVNAGYNIKYVVIGSGPELPRLKKIVNNLGLENFVEFVGWLPHQKVMEYMAIADIFVLPSWQETFGLVYIEAMAHGKPIIAVRGQGVDGIIEDGETGLLVLPRDIESLYAALEFLLKNPEIAAKIGHQAQRLVLNNYLWESGAKKLSEIYKGVLSGSKK